MRKAFPQVIVHKAPHALSEAVQLALSYYTILAEGMETPAVWEEAHLIHRGERFTLPPEQIDAAFADVRAYLRRCRANARPLLEGDPQLGALFQIRLSGMAEDAQLEPFLPSALMLTDVESSEQLTKPLFIRGCLMHLYAMAGMMDLSLQGEEAQAQYHHISDPARFTMAQVMRAVDLVQITDAQRMTLLRFFQDMDAWTLRMTALLAKLETVCRTHYPLVADRFLSKAASLDGQSSDEQAYQWFARMGLDKDAAPSDAPLHVWPAVIAYNGLDIQLSPWHAVRQRMHVGVLFDDLSRLQDAQRAREGLTQEQLKALADPTRMGIVRMLAQRPCYVQEMADRLGLTPATLSHHLRVLSGALLVWVQPQGRQSYYHLNADELAALTGDLNALVHIAKEETL